MNRSGSLRRTPGASAFTTMPPRSAPIPRSAFRPPVASRPVITAVELRPGTAPPRPRRDTGPDKATRELVLKRDGYACVCCGASIEGMPYSLQHRKRRSQGGGNLPSNLVTVLGTGSSGCHWRIDSRIDPADEAKGYTVRSWDDPALVPVMFFEASGSGATVYLLDDGTISAEPPEVA